jgi:hypothetical protein
MIYNLINEEFLFILELISLVYKRRVNMRVEIFVQILNYFTIIIDKWLIISIKKQTYTLSIVRWNLIGYQIETYHF